MRPVPSFFAIDRGYVASCRDIVGAAKSIERTIKSDIPELYILGNPPASVVAFGSRRPDVNVLDVGDAMAKKGWHLNALQNPPAVHIACTVRTLQHSGGRTVDADRLYPAFDCAGCGHIHPGLERVRT